MRDNREQRIVESALNAMLKSRNADFGWIGRSFRLLSRGVLLSSILWSAHASSAETPSKTIIDVTHREGILTVVAVDARLSEVLEEIGRQLRINLSLLGKFDERLTRTIIDASVADVVRQLVTDGTFVIIHDQARADEPVGQIRDIWLYRRASGQASSVVITRKSAPKTLESSATVASGSEGADSDEEVRRQVTELNELSKSARMAMVRQLALRDDLVAIAILGEVLETDQNGDVRREAVKALRNIGDERAVAFLERGLGDPQVGIRMEVVHAIGTTGGDRALLDLGQVVFGEEDAEVRRLATEYLAQNPTDAAQAFLEAASNDPNETVRYEARRALGLN